MYPKDSVNEILPAHRNKSSLVRRGKKKRQHLSNIYGVDLRADKAKSSNDRQQRRPALPTYIHKSMNEI